MSALDHSHSENLYYASNPSSPQQQRALLHETQSLMPGIMAPIHNDTLNNLYYPLSIHPTPTVHAEHEYYHDIQLELENASSSESFGPTIQSAPIDQMSFAQELCGTVYTAGTLLDYASLTRGSSASQSSRYYFSDHGAGVSYNRLNEATMNESNFSSSASGSQAVQEVQEVQSHPTISQPDDDGIYHCLWSGCTDRHGFTQMLSLWRHIKATHIHPGAFKCPYPSCEKRYGRPDSLQAHQRAVGHFYDSYLQQFNPTRSPSYQVSPRH